MVIVIIIYLSIFDIFTKYYYGQCTFKILEKITLIIIYLSTCFAYFGHCLFILFIYVKLFTNFSPNTPTPCWPFSVAMPTRLTFSNKLDMHKLFAFNTRIHREGEKDLPVSGFALFFLSAYHNLFLHSFMQKKRKTNMTFPTTFDKYLI